MIALSHAFRFSPSGGVNVSLDIVPTYNAATTQFDFQSINLALNQVRLYSFNALLTRAGMDRA